MDSAMDMGRLAQRVPEPVREVLGSMREHRAGALAATAAFYGLLSIPPLLIGLMATAALVAIFMGQDMIDRLTEQIMAVAGQALSPETMANIVQPTLSKVLEEPSPGVLSLGYLLALWSASRMVNAVLEGIEILTEQDQDRSKVSTRWLSIKALLIGLLTVAIVLPLLAVGPAGWLGFLGASALVTILGWVLASALGVAALTLFFRAAIPKNPGWRDAAIGALVTLTGWGLGSLLLQMWTERATSGPSLYGPLSAPIALLVWLQLIAWFTLLGSAIVEAVRDDGDRNQVPPVR